MTTPLTLRTVKGSELTFQEADANLTALRSTADTAAAAIAGLSSGMIGKATLALLNADLAYADGTIAYVTNDPTPANNGIYRKTGASGVGSWTQSSYDRVAVVEDQAKSICNVMVWDGVRVTAYIKKLAASDTTLRLVDWRGTTDLSPSTRRIINRYSEPLLAQLVAKSATVTQGALTDHGLSSGITFPAAAQVDYGYLATDVTLITGTKYSGVLFVKMTDLLAPVPGDNLSGDFAVNLGGALIPKTALSISDLGSGLWAIKFENQSVTVVGQTYGVIRYASNSGRGFTVTGFNVWASTTAFLYQKNATATFLDVADYSIAADGKITMSFVPESGATTAWVPTAYAPMSVVTGKAAINPTTHQIRGDYQPFLQFSPFYGAGEMDGAADYSANVLGVYEVMTEDTVFDAVRGRLWAAGTPSDVEWRLWVRDAAGSFDTTTVSPDASGTISAGDFPTSNIIYSLGLGTTIRAAAGKAVTLLFRKTNGGAVSFRYWNTAGSGLRHAFYLSSSTTWPTSFSQSGPPTYCQAAIQLTLGNATEAQGALDVVLPPTLYAVVGRESNVYFDNLINQDVSDFRWDVVCTQGAHQQERWTSGLAPTAGTTTFTVNLYAKNSEAPMGGGNASLVVKAASAGTGLNRKVLVIGDSTTAGGITTGELVTIFGTDAMAITLLGTKGAGSNKHEGISGWTVSKFYTDPTSPFYFAGAFNFSTYMSTNGYASVDWVLINLGINDVFSLTSDAAVDSAAATMISQLEAMITNIHVFNANVRIGIAVTTPPIASQDGFGTDYGCGQTRWRFKRNILRLGRKLINAFSGREATASKVYVVPLNVCLDTLHNMIKVTVAANSRTSDTVTRLNNGVHPDTAGYYQCADAYYAFLKGNET